MTEELKNMFVSIGLQATSFDSEIAARDRFVFNYKCCSKDVQTNKFVVFVEDRS